MPKLKCAVNKGGKTFCNKRKQTGGKTVKNTSYKATKQKPKAKKPKAKKPMSKAYKAAIQREDNKKRYSKVVKGAFKGTDWWEEHVKFEVEQGQGEGGGYGGKDVTREWLEKNHYWGNEKLASFGALQLHNIAETQKMMPWPKYKEWIHIEKIKKRKGQKYSEYWANL